MALIFGNSMATGKYAKSSNDPWVMLILELKGKRRKIMMFLLPQ
jgi:hypothetical protein